MNRYLYWQEIHFAHFLDHFAEHFVDIFMGFRETAKTADFTAIHWNLRAHAELFLQQFFLSGEQLRLGDQIISTHCKTI